MQPQVLRCKCASSSRRSFDQKQNQKTFGIEQHVGNGSNSGRRGSHCAAVTAVKMELSKNAASRARLVLQICAGLLGAWFFMYYMLYSFHKTSDWMEKIGTNVWTKFIGAYPTTFFFEMVPIVLLTILGFIALLLRKQRNAQVRATAKKPRLNVWMTPVILQSPLGMLSLGDLISIILITFVMLFYLIKGTVLWMQEWDAELTPEDPNRATRGTYALGVEWGVIALIPMSLLWIPVSRGSPILNVLGIPFERAVKYHVWLGLLTIWAVTLHGIFLIAYYIAVHQANVTGLFSWKVKEIAILPGFLAGVAGVVMLGTALEWVRRNHFDLFFIAHHLYIVFLLFFSFHCSWCMSYMIFPVLLFFLDRMFRAVQSKGKVDVLSAKVLTSGTIELTVAKPARVSYHPLSFIYVNLPSVSKLMWHPFSVASTPLDGKNEIVIYIKPLGKFTEKLHDVLVSSKQYGDAGKKKVFKCPFSFSAGVEGSYGSESMFYLRYQHLILIAGGIGVTPFLAIIRDILHRYRLNMEELPQSIDLIFCVKNEDELRILDTVALNSILPGFQENVRLTVHSFVTQEGRKGLPNGNQIEMDPVKGVPTKTKGEMFQEEDIILYPEESSEPIREMSGVSSTGHTGWVFAVFFVTIASYFCIFGAFNLRLESVRDNGVVRTMIYMVCIFIAVVIFGGGVMLIWHFVDKKARNRDAQVIGQRSSSESPKAVHEKHGDLEDSGTLSEVPLWKENIIYGRRPVWKNVFDDFAKQFAGHNVGVMVSGLSGLQQDCAEQCRHHSLKRGSTVVFHYHSVSFDL